MELEDERFLVDLSRRDSPPIQASKISFLFRKNVRTAVFLGPPLLQISADILGIIRSYEVRPSTEPS